LEQLISIEFLGRSYNFETDIGDDTAIKASSIVAEALNRISSDSVAPVNERAKIALLLSVALSIASDNVKLQSTNKAMMQRITQLTEGLLKKLETQ
jgi:hypothetical protein